MRLYCRERNSFGFEDLLDVGQVPSYLDLNFSNSQLVVIHFSACKT